jgi:hypothetical protein
LKGVLTSRCALIRELLLINYQNSSTTSIAINCCKLTADFIKKIHHVEAMLPSQCGGGSRDGWGEGACAHSG